MLRSISSEGAPAPGRRIRGAPRGRPPPPRDQPVHAGPARAGQGPAEPAALPPRPPLRRAAAGAGGAPARPTGGRWRSATTCSRGSAAAPIPAASTPGTASSRGRRGRAGGIRAAGVERWRRRSPTPPRSSGSPATAIEYRPRSGAHRGAGDPGRARRAAGGRPRPRLHRLRAASRRGRALVRRPLAAPLRLPGPAAARAARAAVRRARGSSTTAARRR